MGLASPATDFHTDRVSRIRCDEGDKVTPRSSKLCWLSELNGTASMTQTRMDVPDSAQARLAPVIPPPAITMSKSVCTSHYCLNLIDLLRGIHAQYLVAITGN